MTEVLAGGPGPLGPRRLWPIAAAVWLALLGASQAQAQGVCGGARVHWIGGLPAAAFDRGPRDHEQPTVDEPAGLNRELWDALVYDAYDHAAANRATLDAMSGLPLEERRTVVVDDSALRGGRLHFCLQPADGSRTGERLTAYDDPAWWSRQIRRWTNVGWSGEVQVQACAGEPPPDWVYLREGTPDEFDASDDNAVAYTRIARYRDTHGIGVQLARAEIVFNPERAPDLDEDDFEKVLAHQLGHVLGFWHVPPGSGFIMARHVDDLMWSEEERRLANLAYQVGSSVLYPGLVRGGPEPVPTLPFPGVVLLGILLLRAIISTTRPTPRRPVARPLKHSGQAAPRPLRYPRVGSPAVS